MRKDVSNLSDQIDNIYIYIYIYISIEQLVVHLTWNAILANLNITSIELLIIYRDQFFFYAVAIYSRYL